jgi:hypothetical protein
LLPGAVVALEQSPLLVKKFWTRLAGPRQASPK